MTDDGLLQQAKEHKCKTSTTVCDDDCFYKKGGSWNDCKMDRERFEFSSKPRQKPKGKQCYSYSIKLDKNFKLITSSHVSKIIFKDDIATGIEFLKGNKKFIANCNDEIILSAGSISSPQILQLSGVGNQDDLRNYNIDKVKHLRYVGQNLQDHLNVALHYKDNHNQQVF